MQLLAEASADVNCPVSAAYAYTCNLETFGQWFPGVIAIVAEDTLDLTAAGKSYRETVSMPLRGTEQVHIRVKEAERDQHFITEGNLRPLLPRMEIHFQATGPGTSRIEWKMLSRTQSVLLRATVMPWVRRILRQRAKQGMAKLKLILEAQ